MPARMTGAHPRSRVSLYCLTIAFEFVMVGYVWLLGLRPAGKRIRDLIGGKWDKPGDFFKDVGIAFIFWLVVVAYLVSTGLVFGKNPGSLDAMKAMSPRSAVEIVLWVALSVSAGFCEELVFRGYLQRQFYALTGMAPAAVICQALVFGAAHLYQGVQGAAVIAGYGALFGILAASRNSLRPGMIQHGAQDTFTGLLVSIAIRHKLI
jgi:membrane protease YdiL (CAAX protease family)